MPTGLLTIQRARGVMTHKCQPGKPGRSLAMNRVHSNQRMNRMVGIHVASGIKPALSNAAWDQTTKSGVSLCGILLVPQAKGHGVGITIMKGMATPAKIPTISEGTVGTIGPVALCMTSVMIEEYKVTTSNAFTLETMAVRH